MATTSEKQTAGTVLKKLFSAYNRKAETPPTPVVHNLGARGRESVDDPYDIWWNTELAPSVKPGAVTRTLKFDPIPIKEINRKPVAQIIADWIDTNSDLSFIVRSYLDYTISDFELDTANDKSKRRIEGFIEDMGMGGDNFLAFLKRLGYGAYVEGASSYEINFSKDGKRPIGFSYVPPFSLEFQRARASGHGRYDKIIQYANGPGRPPITLQDRANPNPFYRYAPLNVSGTNPYGSSSVEPALWGIVGRQQLLGSLIAFVQGQIFPKGAYAPDLRAILSASPNVNLTASQILEFGNQVAEVVRSAVSEGDITQDLISSFPLLYEVIGVMKDANLQPLDVISKMFAFGIQTGARLPSILYMPENLRTGIGDQKTRIDWTAFDDRCETTGNLMEDEVSAGFDVVLMGDRSTYETYEPEVRLKVVRNDAEIQRIQSEAFKQKMEGYQSLKELGIFSDEQLYQIVVQGKYDFSEFAAEMEKPGNTNNGGTEDE